MREITACNLCGGTVFFSLYRRAIPYRKPWASFISPECFPIHIRGDLCLSCGWIFQNPSFEAHELELLYHFSSPTSSEETELMATLNAERRGQELFLSLNRWLNPTPGLVLDVGGRNGELMGSFSLNGYTVTVLDMDGGDPVDPAVQKVRLPFLQYGGKLYDVVTMLHVLEHAGSPRDFLMHARDLIKEDGLLFIEVPSELMTPLLLRHVGDHRHIGYFTSATLRGFLESCGFTCLLCKLEMGFVGASLPVLKAVARKSSAIGCWKPHRFMILRSLAEVLHPLPLLVRVINKLKSKKIMRLG